MRLRLNALLPAVCSVLAGSAQQNDVPLQRDIYLDLERNAACRSSTLFTGLKPVIQSRADLTGVLGYRPDKTKHYYWITEKLFKEHLADVKQRDFHLTIDPVFRFERGWDFRDPTEFADTTTFYVNSRGLWITCDIGPRLSFQTMFMENQDIFPLYLYQFSQTTGVVPGQGRIKGFKHRAFDHSWAMGNVSWSPRGWLNVQFGNGKHFVGHGYRSVLLSDNSFNYPYLKASLRTNNGRFQYTTIHAKLMPGVLDSYRLPTGESSESLFYWKRAAFHHVEANLGPVQLGLFEATIFQCIDSAGVKPTDPLAYNPVIGVNTAVNGFAEQQEDLIGLDVLVKLTDKFNVYGQFATDDPAKARYAWQAGMHWYDLFHKDLHLQLEYNTATPYMYMTRPARINLVHYGQPMAHPAGAYFNEFVAIFDARVKQRWNFQAKLNLIDYHLDGADSLNFGGNLTKPDFEYTGMEVPIFRHVTYLDLNAGWLMNQMTNMRLTVGCWLRDITNAPDYLGTSYVYVAWSTGLFNRYYDI